MPEAVLTLKLNPTTGERTLIINYESDPDAMSYEHEDDHRAFVEAILGKPLHEVADHIEVKRSPPHPLITDSQQTSSENQEESKPQEASKPQEEIEQEKLITKS